MKTVFITGLGGYLAGVLCRELEHRDWCGRIYGMDVKAPLSKYAKAEFRKMDINAPELAAWVGELKPDIFIHLAFIVDPIPDEKLMEKVNVEGTRSALAAAAGAGCRQVLVASSGTAYGVWPDNPVPLREDSPIRAHPTFKYANDKSTVERLCREFGEAHPEVILSVIRPAVVYGPLVNNYLSALLTSMPIIMGIREYAPPLQFIHEDDVAGAIIMILEKEGRGPFNLAPPDTVRVREAVALTKKPALYLPGKLAELLIDVSWRLRLPFLNAPPSFVDFLRYPWVLDSTRLRDELGYVFRYSTRETLEIMLRAKKVIA
jgi:UDP-glucose 4-epimerase